MILSEAGAVLLPAVTNVTHLQRNQRTLWIIAHQRAELLRLALEARELALERLLRLPICLLVGHRFEATLPAPQGVNRSLNGGVLVHPDLSSATCVYATAVHGAPRRYTRETKATAYHAPEPAATQTALISPLFLFSRRGPGLFGYCFSGQFANIFFYFRSGDPAPASQSQTFSTPPSSVQTHQDKVLNWRAPLESQTLHEPGAWRDNEGACVQSYRGGEKVANMRHAADARRGAARILTALAVLLPAATSSSSQQGGGTPAAASVRGRGLVGEEVAVGFRGSLDAATVRRLQEDDCTEQTSVGDAEAGIAQYEDAEACLREGPLVGCNGEWLCVVCLSSHFVPLGAACAACCFVRRAVDVSCSGRYARSLPLRTCTHTCISRVSLLLLRERSVCGVRCLPRRIRWGRPI